jgi:hypothetical protein
MATLTTQHDNSHDREYHNYLERLNKRFLAWQNANSSPLFTTDAKNLWDLYLDSIEDPVLRQQSNCRTCQRFIEQFGGLVALIEDGAMISPIWDFVDTPPKYLQKSIIQLEAAVYHSRVTGVFLSPDKNLGIPETGPWRHFALTQERIRFSGTKFRVEQKMAEKREDFKNVCRALEVYKLPHLETALRLLESDTLYRSEKILGQAQWLHSLQSKRLSTYGPARNNITWFAIATAPAGFCHPRSSVIGTLLDDIAALKSLDEVKRAFAAKMHPLSYQRPQALPSAGAIAAAEKLVQELGIERSLPRRFARLDELLTIWDPAPAVEQPVVSNGVFGHLKSKDTIESPNYAIPAQTMTWQKFEANVLHTANRIELRAPTHGSYTAFLTAVNSDAPLIFQWNNPISWYRWFGGAPASQFNVNGGKFVEVEAVIWQPSLWGNSECEHHGESVTFILAGARESRQAGAALFPEILKSELHPIRSVIEAYSKDAKIEGMDQSHAAGLMLPKGQNWNVVVRVWRDGCSLDYVLDRWD